MVKFFDDGDLILTYADGRIGVGTVDDIARSMVEAQVYGEDDYRVVKAHVLTNGAFIWARIRVTYDGWQEDRRRTGTVEVRYRCDGVAIVHSVAVFVQDGAA